MQPYRNASGNAGVEAYECGDDWIKVRFRSGPTYVYDSTVPGREHVERMKELADAGDGLTTYINQHVRKSFARTEP